MSDLTLDEFLENDRVRNAVLSEAGWNTLYVRRGYHVIEGDVVATLDLASLEASKPGSGAFGRLVERLRGRVGHRVLYVENVLSDRFAAKLERDGWLKCTPAGAPDWHPPSYYLPKEA